MSTPSTQLESSKRFRKKTYTAWYNMRLRHSGRGRGRDPDAGFYPGNVYWGTRTDLQQYVAHATRVFHCGRYQTVSAIAREVGIHRVSMRERLEREARKKPVNEE